MALQKEKVLASGVSGDYWRVSMLHFERDGMQLEMQVSLSSIIDNGAANDSGAIVTCQGI